MSSRFPESLFLDNPGMAREEVRTCGFRRNSSFLDRAPKIRNSLRVNSFESFFNHSPFDLFRNLGDGFLSQFRVKRVAWATVLGFFRGFSQNCLYFSLIPQRSDDTKRKIPSAVKIELKFYF